ncbi:unnamed protein product [Vitrella brassicaformis CCMP3155]|uniref:Importin N-terminal domain-containing protein n=1 Tax=Vitrella brassicaformis (strain CCMP3155) TaxID=1169540 RepID=A0A0G4F8W8_VITBC|nr:unnamed protein product [Vitrella brassicaformis CCMP3155]|eukprot:CEM08647.1 unnamed protein product [Vitrella brassicaformis CCMP3155]
METLCNSLYNATSEQERSQAHTILIPLTQDASQLPRLQNLIGTSNQPHALVFAATAALKIITQFWAQIGDTQKEELRSFLLNFLAQKGPDVLRSAPQALTQVIRLVCRIVKLAWLEGPQHQTITEHVGQFLQASTVHWVIGLEIYCELTTDMQPQLGPSMSRFRRTALSFRDTALPSIFTVALSTLHKMHARQLQIPEQTQERRLLRQVLSLCCSCLSFDFMGTIPDETSDDQQTVMVPHGWSMLRDDSIPTLFLSLYQRTCQDKHYDCSVICLQCLVLLSSLRRSFFHKEEDRAKLLSSLIMGCTQILSNKVGLDDGSNYHELCRLLGKINTAHQLTELCAADAFQQWIDQVYQFTIESLQSWQHMPNSKHYLLQFWSQMVNPLLFANAKDKAPKALEGYIQQITCAYIQSRLLMAEAFSSDSSVLWEDPLTDEVMRSEQLEVLASLGRCKPQETAQVLMKFFEQVTTQGQAGQLSQVVFEKKVTWLVYMIAAFIAGTANMKTPVASGGNSDRIDQPAAPAVPPHVITGELSSRVFQLINLTDSQSSAPEDLELAYLYFLEQFRKVYFGMHAKQIFQAEVTERLCTVLGLKDDDAVLGLLINKIGRNFQQRVHLEQVIKKSLQLFYELAAGINIVHTTGGGPGERAGPIYGSPLLIVSGRLLLKNETVQSILQRHNHTQFTFLQVPSYGKYRTMYYHTLGKLLFMEVKDNKEPFEEFMQPLSDVVASMWAPPQLPLAPTQLRAPQCKMPLIGLCRDLRGLCLACMNADPYNLLFSWLVEKPKQPQMSRLGLFAAAIDVWWDDPDVVIPLLKFMSEFVHNKANRIAFEPTSPSGILLFKQVANVLCTYGQRMVTRDWSSVGPGVSSGQLYRIRFKGIGIALEMFSHALQGNYTNFGVFEVYQDTSLHDAFAIALQLGISLSAEDLSAYLKTLKPYYLFLEFATRNHMPKMLELCEVVQSTSANVPSKEQGGATLVPVLPANGLCRVLASIEEGLCSFEAGVAMQCCATLDNIVTYLYTTLQKHHQNNRTRQKQRGQMPSPVPTPNHTSATGDPGRTALELFQLNLPPPIPAEETEEEVQRVLRFLYPPEGGLADPNPPPPGVRTVPLLLQRLMSLLFDLVFSGEFTSTWSMSRPLLGLILLQPQKYATLKEGLVHTHTMLSGPGGSGAGARGASGGAGGGAGGGEGMVDGQDGEGQTKRSKLEGYFSDLLSGTEANLSTKTKDHFTRNLYHFAQMIRTSLV